MHGIFEMLTRLTISNEPTWEVFLSLLYPFFQSCNRIDIKLRDRHKHVIFLNKTCNLEDTVVFELKYKYKINHTARIWEPKQSFKNVVAIQSPACETGT